MEKKYYQSEWWSSLNMIISSAVFLTTTTEVSSLSGLCVPDWRCTCSPSVASPTCDTAAARSCPALKPPAAPSRRRPGALGPVRTLKASAPRPWATGPEPWRTEQGSLLLQTLKEQSSYLYFELRSLDARRWPRLWLRERLRWRRCLSRDRERDDFRRSLEVDLDRLRRRSRERDLQQRLC